MSDCSIKREKNQYQGCRTDRHTFVICAYQESPYLEKCIRSLQGQTVRSTILIATSTPNEHIDRLAEKYHIEVRTHESGGLAGDWNYALQSADTEYVTLAHQDDVYARHYTEYILKALEKSSHPLIAFTDYAELRDTPAGMKYVENNRLLRVKRLLLLPLRMRILWKSRFVRRRILSLGSAICCPAVTLDMKNVGMPVFENNMKSNIDWQAWEQISRSRGEFIYVPRIGMAHRIHEGSTTSGLIRDNGRRAEDLYMYKKFWPDQIAAVIELFYQKSEKSNQL